MVEEQKTETKVRDSISVDLVDKSGNVISKGKYETGDKISVDTTQNGKVISKGTYENYYTGGSSSSLNNKKEQTIINSNNNATEGEIIYYTENPNVFITGYVNTIKDNLSQEGYKQVLKGAGIEAERKNQKIVLDYKYGGGYETTGLGEKLEKPKQTQTNNNSNSNWGYKKPNEENSLLSQMGIKTKSDSKETRPQTETQLKPINEGNSLFYSGNNITNIGKPSFEYTSKAKMEKVEQKSFGTGTYARTPPNPIIKGGENWSFVFTGKNITAEDYNKDGTLKNPQKDIPIASSKVGGTGNKDKPIWEIKGNTYKENDILNVVNFKMNRTDSYKYNATSDKYDYIGSDFKNEKYGDKQLARDVAKSEIKNKYMSMTGNLPYISDFLSEGATQLQISGYELEGALLGDKLKSKKGGYKETFGTPLIEAKTDKGELLRRGETRQDLLSKSYQRSIGTSVSSYITGYGGGYVLGGAGAGVGGATGLMSSAYTEVAKNVGLTAVKVGATYTGFEVGLTAVSGGDVSKKLTFENFGKNVIIGTGISGVGLGISEKVLRADVGFIKGQVLSGAGIGAVAGTTFSFYEGDSERSLEYALTGAVIGGVLSGAGAYAETKGIKPVLQLAETREVNVKTGVVSDKIKGVKLGLEKIDFQTGNTKFYGITGTGEGVGVGTGDKIKFFVGEGAKQIKGTDIRVIPKGIAETKLYANKDYNLALKDSAVEFGKGYSNKVNEKIVLENINKVAKNDAQDIIKAVNKGKGIFGGSSVQKGVGNQQTSNLRNVKDLDIVFTSNNDFSTFKSNLPKGSSVSASKTGLNSVENLYIQKYAVKTPSGAELDVSVLDSSLAMPKSPSPFSSYTALGSYNKGKTITTYSPQQQVGTKFMTIGASEGGKIKVIETGKEKYIYDIASFNSKSPQQTQQKFNYYTGGSGANQFKSVQFTNTPQVVSVSTQIKPSNLGFSEYKSSKQPSSNIKLSNSNSITFKSIISVSTSKPQSISSLSVSSLSSDSISSKSSDSNIGESSPPPPSEDEGSGGSSSSVSISSISISSISKPSFNFNYNFNVPPPVLPLGLPLGTGGGGGYGRTRKSNVSKKLFTLQESLNLGKTSSKNTIPKTKNTQNAEKYVGNFAKKSRSLSEVMIGGKRK